MTNIYLVRHGQVNNSADILYGQMDEEIELTEAGKKQIHDQAQQLKTISGIEVIYHSPLKRTRQTAAILEAELKTGKLVSDRRLIDTATVLQGMPMAEFDRVWGGFLYHPELLAKGGESMEDVWFRMQEVLYEIAENESGKDIVVVSHGDPIRIVMLAAEGKSLTRGLLGSDRHPVEGVDYPEKGSVTVLEVNGRQIFKKDYWPSSNN